MTDHNYASCDDPICQRCEDYSSGYRDGKSKALFEVSTTHHPAGCGCDPCQAVAERLRRRADLREFDPYSSSGDEPERDRGALPSGLEAELALLLGIELSDGGLL